MAAELPVYTEDAEEGEDLVEVTVQAKSTADEKVLVRVRETVSLGEIKALLAGSIGRPGIQDGRFVRFMPNGDTVNVSDSVKLQARRALIFDGEPLYPIPEKVYYSVEDFCEFDPAAEISSPRSLRACDIEGVLPEELAYAPPESFLSQTDSMAIAHLRRDFFEAFRQDCLVAVRRSRKMLIAEDEGEAERCEDNGNGDMRPRGSLGITGSLVTRERKPLLGLPVGSQNDYPTVLHFFKEMRRLVKLDRLPEFALQVPEPDYGGVTPVKFSFPQQIVTGQRTLKDLHWQSLSKSRRARGDELPKPKAPDFHDKLMQDAEVGERAVFNATREAERRLAKLRRMPRGGAESCRGVQLASAARAVANPRQNLRRLRKVHDAELDTIDYKVEAAEVQQRAVDLEHERDAEQRKLVDERHLEAQGEWACGVQKVNWELAKACTEKWTRRREEIHELMLSGEDKRNDHVLMKTKEEHARAKRVAQLRDLRQAGYAKQWAERRIQWHANMEDTAGKYEAWQASVGHRLYAQDQTTAEIKKVQEMHVQCTGELRELRTVCAELMHLREKRRQAARRNAIAETRRAVAAEEDAAEQQRQDEHRANLGAAGAGLGLASSWEWSQPAARFPPGSMADLSYAVGLPTSKRKSSAPGSIHAPGRRTKVNDHPHVQPKLRCPGSGPMGMPRFDFPRNSAIRSSLPDTSTLGASFSAPSLQASRSLA